MIESGTLKLDCVKFFVLDEADRLLDTGNLPTILRVFSAFPKSTSGPSRLQVCLLWLPVFHSPAKEAQQSTKQKPFEE